MKLTSKIIFCCFALLAIFCVVSASRDAFDVLGDYLGLTDALIGGSSSSSNSGSGKGSSNSSGGKSSSSSNSSGKSSSTSTGAKSSTTSGRSPTTSRQSGYNRAGRVSGPGRAPTSLSNRAPSAAQINARVSSAFSAIGKAPTAGKLTAQSIRSFAAKTYGKVGPSMLSAKPMGPLSTFSKVNPSMPTNTFTKPTNVPTVTAPTIKNVPVPTPRPADIPSVAAPAKQSAKAKDVIAAMEKHVLANAKAEPTGYCARHVANAIDAALGTKFSRPMSAKDFGPGYLTKNGFKPVSGPIQVGDVQVFQGGFTDKKGHFYADGHMQMKTSQGFVSDFRQRDVYAGPGYRAKQQEPTNYRYGG